MRTAEVIVSTFRFGPVPRAGGAFRSEGTEREMVDRARGGDGEAIAMLVEWHSRRVHRYLAHLLGRLDLADDVLQDTWLRVVERLHTHRRGEPFLPWLFAVARNCAIDVLRRRRREGVQVGVPGEDPHEVWDRAELIGAPGPSALDVVSELQLRERVAATLSGLPAAYREALALRFGEEMPLEEMARITGAPLSTVKTRLYRGLALLRHRLEKGG